MARARAIVRALAAALASLGASLGTFALAQAAPRIPANDGVVLEHVPAAAATRRLEPLRARLSRQPADLNTAIALAEGYLQIGRETADPRFISYAQSTLSPWLDTHNPPARVLVLMATVLQNLHRFDPALQLIDRALAAEPGNTQALLTKATILQVQGRFDEARPVCRSLIEGAGQLIAITCLTGVNSLTGHLESSYRALQAVYSDDPRLPVALRTWVLGQLGDMAVRLGKPSEAEAHFQAALRANPEDLYIKASYADLLLQEHRPEETVQLLKGNEAQDNLLLRLAIAGVQLQGRDGRRWSDLFQARFEAARRDGDFTHLREQARFVLDVQHDPARALELARQNWRVQHEPDDVRIYSRAALATRAPAAWQPVSDWIRATRYEDATLEMPMPRTAESAHP